MLLAEDRPDNYITQLIRKVFSVATTAQQNKLKLNYIDFNDNSFKDYAKYRALVSNAVDNYLITEGSHFNY